MSREQIQQLIGSLAKTVEDSERIATPILAVKLAKCVEAYPYDQTLGMMSRVIEKMASNDNIFIRRSELKNLYRKLYSSNTKFAELFANELGSVEELPEPTIYQRDEATKEINQYEVGDSILSNALGSAFDKHLPVKMYSQPLADKTKISVASTLDAWNLTPNALEVEDGNDKFLVIRADYETPKGITSFYVPVEVRNGKVIEPNVFMGNTGPLDLNHTEIKSYLTSYAGNKLRITASAILGVIVKSASENREISDVELAVTRMNAAREGKSEFFQNQIVGQKISQASVKDVELPKYDEFLSFEKSFTSPYGLASFAFGAEKIKTARDSILRELVSYGYKNPQLAVTSHNKDTIVYGVSLDAGKVAFTVPVKVIEGKVNKPSVMVCNGSISAFDKNSINSLYVNNQTDYKVAAITSPMAVLKPSEVLGNLRDAVIARNYSKAEDALNVLANSGDAKAYASGFQLFVHGLADKKEEAVKCSMIVKSSTSEHPVCGHTGLPIHKVYQDKEGNCRPLYRRGMDETYEGASFMNAKIFG